MRVVFMGTPEFAVSSLVGLVEAGHEICAVFTKPDRPFGRKQVLKFSAVKEFALKHGFLIYQPAKFSKQEENLLRVLSPDVVVVVAYGNILPRQVLELPKYGCINIHASLLPKYRGASPVQACLINCDSVTGVTAQYMAEGLDTGDIIKFKKVVVYENETAPMLSKRLSEVGSKLLVEVLDDIGSGIFNRVAQDEAGASYVSVLNKTIAKIDFSKSSRKIHGLICGLSGWPCAYCFLNGKVLKIFRSALVDKFSGDPGEILSCKKFIVGCGSGAVEFVEVQLEGKKRMLSGDFLNGTRLVVGDFLC